MDKIHYLPTEGTTGFWGLRGVPERPECDPQKWDDHSKVDAPNCRSFIDCPCHQYEATIESCKEKKLEIVNPEECFTYGPYARNGSNEVIKFKEGEIFDLPIWYSLQPEGEFLRLVKESQTWTDIYNLGQEHGVRNYIAILSSEIEKKKQSIVNDLGRNDYAMYNGGYSQALKEISELLDSLTPKK